MSKNILSIYFLVFIIGLPSIMYFYQKSKNSTLESEIEESKKEILKVESNRTVAVFEERWRTIKEINRTKMEEINENIFKNDINGTITITF
jgi:hypothetical protein